ncbi:MAG: hypothetical protein WC610_02305 [Patescibacteria group bacterium]
MIIDQCNNHIWEKVPQGKYTCKNCHAWAIPSEVFQLEAIENQTKLANHQLGFQKWLSILAFVVSVAAVIIAWLK